MINENIALHESRKWWADESSALYDLIVHGITPLHVACKWVNSDSSEIELLLSQGADVRAKDNDRWTPLHHACRCHEITLPAVQKLISHGADVNEKTPDGDTPLHLACVSWSSQLGCLAYLMERVNNLNEKNNSGVTPFARAVQAGQIEIVRFLIDRGLGTLAQALDIALEKIWCRELVSELFPGKERAHELIAMRSLDRLVERFSLPIDTGNTQEEKLVFYASVKACQLEHSDSTPKHEKARAIRNAIGRNDPALMLHAVRLPEINTHFWQRNIPATDIPEALLSYEKTVTETTHHSRCLAFDSMMPFRYSRF